MERKLTETAHFVMDERRYPLILVRFRGQMSDATAQFYLERSDRCIEDDWIWAVIIEATTLNELGSNQRRRFSDWIAKNRAALARQCVCQAYVLTSVVQRMAIRSVLMFSPMPAPYRVFETVDAAESWCSQMLRQEGLSPGPRPADWGGTLDGGLTSTQPR